jgi:RNA polymerase sigma factor (sigma-70 family)
MRDSPLPISGKYPFPAIASIIVIMSYQAPVFDSIQLYAACASDDLSTQENAYQKLWPFLHQIAYQVLYRQPDAADLAQDCAQKALIRIHNKLADCQEPAAFRTWARRIVSHLAIDELRRRKRLVQWEDEKVERISANSRENSLESLVLEEITLADVQNLINSAPISQRSRRVIIGRYVHGLPDEEIAQSETDLAEQTILPSHVQVTRAKNISKLRKWPLLQQLMNTEL